MPVRRCQAPYQSAGTFERDEQRLGLAREAQPQLDGVAVLHELEAQVALGDVRVVARHVRVGRSHERRARVEDDLEGERVS